MSKWGDSKHLIRPALVFLAGSLAFLSLRQLLVPASFGQYGHYRGAVLQEVRRQPVRFAGERICAGCHPEVINVKAGGKHGGVHCEACHGPAATHAENPTTISPRKPEPIGLCVRCHEASSAKPSWFPQVEVAVHSGGDSCGGCHSPHQPKP